jgi:OOP family OmpA-OmpF porin
MSKYRIGLALAGAVLLAPSLVLADDMDMGAGGARQGWYSSLGAGLNILRNSDIKGSGFETHGDFNDGYVVNGAIGYQWGHLRGEGEIGYRHNDLDHLTGLGGKGSGDASAIDLMANGYYDFLPYSKFDPYIGAGIGVARVDYSSLAGAAGTTLIDQTDTKFAYQGIVGARYLIAPQWDLGAEYRYFATLTPHVTTTAATVPASIGVDAPYRNHSIMLGLTYHFTPPASPPPPAPAPAMAQAPAAPPPAPPAKPGPSVYIVFFEFDKSDISAVSAQVLDRATADFHKSGSVKFLVQGYTDLSGSVEYNQKLSERRAEAVKKYLLAHGVTTDQITTEWFGKSNPRVPTADGVKNQENRRAEIYLKQ